MYNRNVKSGETGRAVFKGACQLKMALEKEMETYKKKLPELKEHEGKYALVQGNDLVDVFVTYEDALKEGYQKFGLQPFLVKKIESPEQIHTITRLVAPQGLISP